MNDVEIELNTQELTAIHHLANELDCSPNQAMNLLLEHHLVNQGAKKQSNNLAEIYSKLSELFGELATQAA